MIRLSELSLFCRRMGTGLHSGVDTLRLIESESKTGNHKHRQAMQRLAEGIRSGDTLAESMKRQPEYFPNLLIQLVHASELSGRVESMFSYMAEYYDQLKQTRRQFLQKITWPMIQLGMAIGIIGLVILIQAVLSPNTAYDASALGLRGYRGFMIYCLSVLLIAGIMGLIVRALWKNWFQCHKTLMPFVQRIPQLGTALVTLGLSRLSVTLSMLLNAGVDARHAVKQAFLATGNYYFIGGMQRAVKEVGTGASFGDAFEKSEVLPQEFVDAVRTGELSGSETETLDYLAKQYQQRAAAALETLATIASVVVWFSTILLIGFLVIRMFLQLINYYNDMIENPMGN